MKKIVKQLLEILFFFRKFQLQTTLKNNEILKRVERFVVENDNDYMGYITEDGFRIVEKHLKSFLFFGYIMGTLKTLLLPSP